MDRFNFNVEPVNGLELPKPEGPLPLYVHVPFCPFMCPFCVFFSVPYSEAAARAYVKSLTAEVEGLMSRWEGVRFPEVYVGGGTPTMLTEGVCELLDVIRSYQGTVEASVEGSPYDVDDDKVSMLASAGVTRISLGVQSFSPDRLARLGRPRISSEAILSAIGACSRVKTVNVDIIFNYPGQREGDLVDEIEAFYNSKANQLTLYPIMPSIREQATIRPCSEEKERALYRLAVSEARRLGLTQLTTWCFSKSPSGLKDEYIIDSDLFVGAGAGAMSHLRGLFTANTFNISKYESLVARGRPTVSLARRLSREEEERLYALYGLYGLRLDKEGFRRKFGRSIYRAMPRELLSTELLGLVKDTGRSIVPTDRGLYAVSLLMKLFYIKVSHVRAMAIRASL
ncbi:MAG: radical SAM protein [Acidilobus sp.]